MMISIKLVGVLMILVDDNGYFVGCEVEDSKERGNGRIDI